MDLSSQEKDFVVFDKIDKSYDGEVLVVKNLNLNIAKGEFVTMLGPSGSGKTTTLMMLAGFETPTNGEIFLEGKTISKIPPYEREIGMVFQNYALFPHMTVEKNVAYGLKLRKLPKAQIENKVGRVLELVGLEGLNDRMPHELSGGQQQRVNIARALIQKHEIFLGDEPVSALDDFHKVQVIQTITEQFTTCIFALHDLDLAMSCCQRIIGIARGKIIFDEPVNQVSKQQLSQVYSHHPVLDKNTSL